MRSSRRANNTGIGAYGPLGILPALFAFLATFFTYMASWDCHFFQSSVVYEHMPNVVYEHMPNVALGFGLWTTESFEVLPGNVMQHRCELWRNSWMRDRLDSAYMFSRVVSMISMVVAVLVLAATLVPAFRPLGNPLLQGLAAAHFALCVLTVLFFVVLASNVCRDQPRCTPGRAAAFAGIAAFLWVLSALFVSLLIHENSQKEKVLVESQKRPVMQVAPAPILETKEVKRILQNDGRVVVRTVVTHPDGSKNVHEEVISPVEDEEGLQDVPLNE